MLTGFHLRYLAVFLVHLSYLLQAIYALEQFDVNVGSWLRSLSIQKQPPQMYYNKKTALKISTEKVGVGVSF